LERFQKTFLQSLTRISSFDQLHIFSKIDMVQIGKFIKDNKTLERDRAYLRGVLESMWFRKIKLLSELFGFKRPAPQLPVRFQC
jgi:hypothetical protein